MLTATAAVALPTPLPWDGQILGARQLTVAASAPVTVTLVLEGDGTRRNIAFSELAASQVLPILGMRLGRDYTAEVTVTDASGHRVALAPVSIPGDPLPEDWPIYEVLAQDPARAAPGWIQVDTNRDYDTTHLVFLDRDLQPSLVWSYLEDLQDTDLVGDGTLLSRTHANGWLFDLLGNVVHQWGYQELDADHYLPTETEEFHHEIIPLGSRFAVLSSRTIQVDAYPTAYASPGVLGGPAELRDPSLAVVDQATGAVESQWFLSDYLDTTRISFDALSTARVPDEPDDPLDWAHANAAAVDLDGGYLVAVRHQDVILKLDPAGALVWLLGDPAGWGPAWQPYLLAAPAGMQWPFHVHGLSVDAATGVISTLDNGNNGYTPYESPVAGPVHSRAVGYRVDAAAGTVEQAWAYENTATGLIFAASEGDAVVLPDGNVFADFGLMLAEGSASSVSLGWGERFARMVEWTPDSPGSPVLDVRIRADAGTDPDGWSTYRATKVPSLYPTSGPWRATDTWDP